MRKIYYLLIPIILSAAFFTYVKLTEHNIEKEQAAVLKPTGVFFVSHFNLAPMLGRFESPTSRAFSGSDSAVDVPDDIEQSATDSSVNQINDSIILEFPLQLSWKSSVLHKVKKHLSFDPPIEGKWYVVGTGQKLLFKPSKKSWESKQISAGSTINLKLNETVVGRRADNNGMVTLEPFVLPVTVSECDLVVSPALNLIADTSPPTFELTVEINSAHSLISDKEFAPQAFSLDSKEIPLLLKVESPVRRFYSSGPFALKEFNEIIKIVLPQKKYAQNASCMKSQPESLEVSVEKYLKTFKVTDVNIEIDYKPEVIWPRNVLLISTNFPVDIEVLKSTISVGVGNEVLAEGAELWSKKNQSSATQLQYDIVEKQLQASQKAFVKFDFTKVDPNHWLYKLAQEKTATQAVEIPRQDFQCPEGRAIAHTISPKNEVLLFCGQTSSDLPQEQINIVEGLRVYTFPNKIFSEPKEILNTKKDFAFLCQSKETKNLIIAQSSNTDWADGDAPWYLEAPPMLIYYCNLKNMECHKSGFEPSIKNCEPVEFN